MDQNVVLKKSRCKSERFVVLQVDTHVHAASSMNQKHLLRFIKKTMKERPTESVCKNKEGKEMTLAEVSRSLRAKVKRSRGHGDCCNIIKSLVVVFLNVPKKKVVK